MLHPSNSTDSFTSTTRRKIHLSEATVSTGIPHLALSGLHLDPNEIVGVGGSRGSTVFRVRCSDGSGPSTACACKMYAASMRSTVPSNELQFIHVALRCSSSCEGEQRGCALEECSGAEEATLEFGVWDSLVIPDAVIMHQERAVGIVMPLFSNSLEYLMLHPARHSSPVKRTAHNEMGRPVNSEDVARTPFRNTPSFNPIRETKIVAAIAFLVALGVDTLHQRLPHAHGGVEYTGFAHCDLRMDNILFSRFDGRLSICDFELVQHMSETVVGEAPRVVHQSTGRSVGRAYLSPQHVPSDEWMFGLLLLELLTGIRPFMDERVAFDDFGDGPLLCPAADCDNPVDWQRNMEAAVACRLSADPDGPPRLKPTLSDFLGSLLNNDDRQRSRMAQLLDHRWFAEEFDCEDRARWTHLAKNIIREWARAIWPEAPRHKVL